MFYPFRYLLAIAALLLLASSAFAQRDRDAYPGGITIEVSGHVRLADSGLPARNASVRLELIGGGLVDQMPTDNQGKFRFQNLARGIYKITVTTQGYNAMQQQADVQTILRSYLLFELVPENAISSSDAPLTVLDARVPLEAQKEFERGRAALALKDSKQALAHLEKAVQLYPDFFEAQLLLGTTYINERKWREAEDALRRALQAKPEQPAPLFALGEVYRRQKRYADAEKLIQDGLKLDENSWQGYFTLGRVYWEMGDAKRAGPPIGRTLQLKPDFAEAHLLAGNILLRFDAADRALVEYEEYLRLAPKGEFAPQTRQLVEKLKKTVKK